MRKQRISLSLIGNSCIVVVYFDDGNSQCNKICQEVRCIVDEIDIFFYLLRYNTCVLLMEFISSG
jgi:hypothetical protein